MKPFQRPTRTGVKIHKYWVVKHEVHKRDGWTTVTHYIGKKLKGDLKKLGARRAKS